MKLCGFTVGGQAPFFLISGPCVIESEALAMESATALKAITDELGIPFIYKSSFDKANRSSHQNFRGIGFEEALEILAKVKSEVGVPVITDVHENTPLDEVAEVADVLQTPALLCRQTDYIQSVAKTHKPLHIKKGQFMSPWEMEYVVEKARAVGNEDILVCERGYSFGYNNLVSDMRSLVVLRETRCPVVFDATHSVQLPGAGKGVSKGQREFVPALSSAAVAVGVAGLFMESHPRPDEALSDGPNSWPTKDMRDLLMRLQALDQIAKQAS